MREPTVAWWPGRIPAGTISDEIASVTDLLPTFARLSGAEVPSGRVIDGRDISDILLGRPGAATSHDALFYYKGHRLKAVRSGPWKLFCTTGALYNLDEDIGERDDVSARHPDVAARLERHLARAEAEIGADETACPQFRAPGRVKTPHPIIPHEDAARASWLAEQSRHSLLRATDSMLE